MNEKLIRIKKQASRGRRTLVYQSWRI